MQRERKGNILGVSMSITKVFKKQKPLQSKLHTIWDRLCIAVTDLRLCCSSCMLSFSGRGTHLTITWPSPTASCWARSAAVPMSSSKWVRICEHYKCKLYNLNMSCLDPWKLSAAVTSSSNHEIIIKSLKKMIIGLNLMSALVFISKIVSRYNSIINLSNIVKLQGQILVLSFGP